MDEDEKEETNGDEALQNEKEDTDAPEAEGGQAKTCKTCLRATWRSVKTKMKPANEKCVKSCKVMKQHKSPGARKCFRNCWANAKVATKALYKRDCVETKKCYGVFLSTEV